MSDAEDFNGLNINVYTPEDDILPQLAVRDFSRVMADGGLCMRCTQSIASFKIHA